MPTFGSGVVYAAGVYGGGTLLLAPSVGPVTGGTEVEISGFSLLDTSCDDDFSGGVVDPGKWTVATNGAGSAATQSGGRLHLAAGVAVGSYARISSVATFLDVDTEVSFDVQTDVAALVPSAPVELAALRLLIDANNYAQIARKTGGAFGNRYEVTVVVGGIAIESAYLPTSDLTGTLRVIRRGTTIYLYANDIEVLRRSGFPTTAAKARVQVDNLTAAYSIATDFDNFYVHTMVVLGTEPMLDAQALTSDRVIGTTPPGVRVATVPLYIATATLNLPVLLAAFTYEDATQFVVLAPLSGEVNVAITNDTVLRNLQTNRPGFTR